MSHAHVGHALTAWRDTPGEQGLFVVAEREAAIALEQASAAVRVASNPARSRQHLANFVHALDPTLRDTGAGLEYGAIRALEGAADHLVFAGEMSDASTNIIAGSAQFAEGAGEIAKRLRVAVEAAQLADAVGANKLRDLAVEVEQLAIASVHGEDLDQDGIVGSSAAEYGLAQLRDLLQATIDNENPPYHPLGRFYLFGLVKLPNGQWAYRFHRSNTGASFDSPGGGY
ncbi:MAG: hypothetical protein ACR2RL_11540 [Gammaproteobacteria bacterium]